MNPDILTEMIRENRISLITDMVEEYIYKENSQCHIREAKNGWPVGYAKTFKIFPLKKRENRK